MAGLLSGPHVLHNEMGRPRERRSHFHGVKSPFQDLDCLMFGDGIDKLWKSFKYPKMDRHNFAAPPLSLDYGETR